MSNIGGALSFFYSGKIIDKFNPLRVLKFEIISNRIVNFIALLFPTGISPILMSSASLTYGVGSVATNSLLQKEFTQNQRATLSSLNSFVGSIVFGICAVLLGIVADKFDARTALIVVQFLLILPLLFYKKIFENDNKTNFPELG